MDAIVFKVSDAHKLEDPARLEWLPPPAVIEALQLRAEMAVADIGTGTGFFAIPMARVVARVYAIDVQREMLDLFRRKNPAANIELIEGSAEATTLGERAVDVAFLATVWHELDNRDAVLGEMRRILKPGGTLAILDWRPDVDRPPGPGLEHRIAMSDVIDELHEWDIVSAANIGRYTYLVQGR